MINPIDPADSPLIGMMLAGVLSVFGAVVLAGLLRPSPVRVVAPGAPGPSSASPAGGLAPFAGGRSWISRGLVVLLWGGGLALFAAPLLSGALSRAFEPGTLQVILFCLALPVAGLGVALVVDWVLRHSMLPMAPGRDPWLGWLAPPDLARKIIVGTIGLVALGTLAHFLAWITTGERLGVLGAAWSSDDRYVLTASYDRTARIFDAGSGEVLRVLDGHDGWVLSAAWSPDDRRVVTTSRDGTARIFDAETGEQLRVLAGHGDWVRHASWSPDGRRVVTASRDGTARIWDPVSGELLRTLVEPAMLRSAVWSADGSRILTASRGGAARIWDATTGELIRMLEAHDDWVRDAVWSADGERVLTAGRDATARVFDLATGARLLELTGHTISVETVAPSSDDRRILTASRDGTARIYDAVSGDLLRVLDDHDSYIMSAAWSSDDRRVLTASRDVSARIFDAETGAELKVLRGHLASVLEAAWSAERGRTLVWLVVLVALGWLLPVARWFVSCNRRAVQTNDPAPGLRRGKNAPA